MMVAAFAFAMLALMGAAWLIIGERRDRARRDAIEDHLLELAERHLRASGHPHTGNVVVFPAKPPVPGRRA